MHHTADAGHRYRNRQGYLRGTREDVLEEIKQWLAGEWNQRVFWLCSLAEIGKSTIPGVFAHFWLEVVISRSFRGCIQTIIYMRSGNELIYLTRRTVVYFADETDHRVPDLHMILCGPVEVRDFTDQLRLILNNLPLLSVAYLTPLVALALASPVGGHYGREARWEAQGFGSHVGTC